MASIHIRFLNGETDSWQLHDTQKPNEVLRAMFRIMSIGGSFGFGVQTEEGQDGIDYGMVLLRMNEVSRVHIDGILDEKAFLGTWAEVDGGLGEDGDTSG